jgi:hypothetical protein
MIDLIRAISLDHFFGIMDFLKNNPGVNTSALAQSMNLHIVTIQKVIDVMEKYGFVSVDEKKGVGRPSKIYRYKGGSFKVDLDILLEEYQLRLKTVRESGKPNISFSYDVDKEIINAVLIGGKSGEKVKLEEKNGKFLWLVPSPDSKGRTIEDIAKEAGIPVPDAIRFAMEMIQLGIIEEV